MGKLGCWILFLAMAGNGFGQDIWTVDEATTSVQFHHELLRDLGIELTRVDRSANAYRPDFIGFAAEAGSPMFFQAPGGDYERMQEGSLRHRGGVVLERAGKSLSLLGFEIRVAQSPYEFELLDADGQVWFYLHHAHPRSVPDDRKLRLLNLDLVMAPAFTEWLGLAEWVPQFMGSVDFVLTVDVPEGFDAAEGSCTANFEGDKDVELTFLGNVSQFAREPGGRVAIAPSASLRNAGNVDVPWYRAIDPDGTVGQHPYLVLHFYRLLDGKFEQLGRSDLKHAFFSVNSGCPCPGDQILYVGCSDTYGAGTNGNRFYLAPRDELTAHTGDWQSLGSHFDATPVDDFRHHGSSGHDNFDHRLVVTEPDLQTAGARYFIEAWYVVKEDINIFNSMGYREVAPTFTGSFWSFPFQDNQHAPGPAIDAWVNPEAPLANEVHARFDAIEGHLRLVSKTTALGDNHYRYEIAVMNLDLDRQISQITIPRHADITISAQGFFDGDTDPGNDWIVTEGTDTLTWQAPAGNALDWGTLYNFRFQANSEPIEDLAALGILEPGFPNELNLNVLAPLTPCVETAEFLTSVNQWPAGSSLTELVEMINRPCI